MFAGLFKAYAQLASIWTSQRLYNEAILAVCQSERVRRIDDDEEDISKDRKRYNELEKCVWIVQWLSDGWGPQNMNITTNENCDGNQFKTQNMQSARE